MSAPAAAPLAGAVARQVLGRTAEIHQLVAALTAGRDVVLEGPPGTSKSTLLRATARTIGRPVFQVDGSAYLTPARLVGHHDPSRVLRSGYSDETFVPGPLVQALRTGGILYVEELNRVPDDTLNVLLGPLAERRIIVPRFGAVSAAPGFLLVAAMNPHDDAGAARLSRSIADRMVRLRLGYQPADEERRIVALRAPDADPRLVDVVTRIVRATRGHPRLRHGSSIRGAIDLALVAPRLAVLAGIALDLDGTEGAEVLVEAALVTLSGRVEHEPHGVETVEDVIAEIVLRELTGRDRAVRRRSHADRGARAPVAGAPVPRPLERSRVWRRPKAADAGVVHDSATAARAASSVAAAGTGAAAAPASAGAPASGPAPSTGLDGVADPASSDAAFGDLEPATLAEARRIARLMTLRMARRVPTRVPGASRMHTTRYAFRSDDLDLDRTIEELVGNPLPAATDFWILDRVRARRAFALLVDVSGSMRGTHLETAAMATASTCAALTDEHVGVVAFWGEAAVIKRPHETRPLERVLADILSLRARGLTNIELALRTGLRLLSSSNTQDRVGMLLSDGAHNLGPDPIPLARRYDTLHVVATSADEHRVQACLELAEAGGGRCAIAATPAQIPLAVSRCLA